MKFNTPFNNPKLVIITLVIFLGLFFFLRSGEAHAGAAEIGLTYTGEFNSGVALVYTERLAGKWDIGTKLISKQNYNGSTIENNGGIFGQRIVSTKNKRFELGLGFSYWIKTSDLIGCHAAWDMSVRWNITDRIPLTVRHNSNAGICENNRGQDMLTIGWSFR